MKRTRFADIPVDGTFTVRGVLYKKTEPYFTPARRILSYNAVNLETGGKAKFPGAIKVTPEKEK